MKLFVSHSSRDVPLVAPLVELVRSALNLKAQDIRCTSLDGYRLPAGTRTDEQLRREVVAAPAFIGVVSAPSLKSMYVLFELGARWGAGKHLIPLLSHAELTESLVGPLQGLNAMCADSEAQLHQLIEDLGNVLGTSADSPAAYGRYVSPVVHVARAVSRGARAGIRKRETPGQPAAPSNSGWPTLRTYSALEVQLRRLSDTNRKILRTVADRKRLYARDLCDAVALERGEVVYRAKELEVLHLLHVESLTDKRYELHEDLKGVLGESYGQVLSAMLA